MSEANTHAAHCHVLDVVEVTGVPGVGEGNRGVVTQVRRYPDGAFRYAISVGEEGLIIDGANVVPTGSSDPIDGYLPPGSLFPWDEVEIQQSDPALRGVIDGWYDDAGTTKYFVWIQATSEQRICEEAEVVRVGRSHMRRSGASKSTMVSEAGEPTRVDDYVILEDLMDVVADAAPGAAS